MLVRRHLILLPVICIGLLSLAWLPLASAQPGRVLPNVQASSSDELAFDSSIFSPAPRELRQRIKYAKQALDQRRFTEASALLGSLVAGRLEETDNQDYFIQAEGEAQRMVSIKAEAQKLIGNMPPAGREVYELQFGAEARQMLKNALAQRDAQQLAEVTRLFFHTEAGYEASILLGRYYLDRGKPLAAALTLQSLTQYPQAAKQYDPEISLLLSTCWMLASMPERARETLEDLQQRMPAAELQLQGLSRQLPTSDQDLLQWLETQLGGRPQFSRIAAQQWAMHRGEPARNAEAEGGAPIYHPRWIAPLNTAIEEEELITQVQEEDFLAENVAPLPAIQPLAVDDTVMVRTPSSLMGINFRTGKRVWTFPWNDASDWELPNSPVGNSAAQGAELRREQLKQRLFYDSPYGQLSSDGDSVFLIDELGFAAIGGRSHFIRRGGVRERNQMWASDFNQLMALDIEREGALKWIIGGQSGEDEPQLAGAFFLGPPLPLMGQLFVMAEINGEIRLVVLDADTGRYQWSQQLAVVGQRNIMSDQMRRLAGASPSFADGVLVCPTSAGAVVAVDVSTRTLLWGFTYKTPRSTLQSRMQMQRGNVEMPDDFWADATVSIARGKVIVTPRESDQLYCLDLLTGKPQWPARHRNELCYHACTHNEIAVFVGNHRVAGMKLDDGTPAWGDNVTLESLPSGRGFYSGNHYYLPTTNAKLLKIDLNTGELVRTYETEHALGNLICFRDQVLSLTPHSLETYYQAEPLRDLVKQQLKENPENPKALAQHAELLLQDGNQKQALAALRKAWKISPQDVRISRLLVKTMLSALHSDFAEYREVATELEGLIEGPQQQAQYLRLMAAGYSKAGESEKAFAAYMELASPDSTSSSLKSMEEVERFYTIRRDRWLQAQLASLVKHADEKQRLALLALIDEKLQAALDADELSRLSEANALFGFTEKSAQVRLRMAELLLQAERTLQAEALLTHLQRAANQQIASTAALRLAELLEQHEKHSEALRQYQYIAAEYHDQPLQQAQTGQQLLAAFLQRHSDTPLMGTPGNWPHGEAVAELENTRSARRPSYQRIFPITVRHQQGPSPLGMQVAFDQAHNDILITSGWGQELQRASLNRNDGRRFYLSNYNVTSYDALGHLVVASVGSELMAVDTLAPLRTDEADTAAVLWRHDTYHSGENTIRLQSKGLENPWGTARYVGIDNSGRRVGSYGPITRSGLCVQRSLEVVCLDPLTGEVLWSRRDTEPGSELFGDHEHLFVVPPKGPARVFSMLDGSEVGTREVPGESQRWHTMGSQALCWKRDPSAEKGEVMSIYLLDAFTEETLWSKQFPLGTKATLVEHNQVAFLTPEGDLQILNMADGTPAATADLELGHPLASLHVMRSSGEYLVAAGLQRPRTNSNRTSIQPQPSGLYAPLVDGKLWCIDRGTGNLRWQSPAEINRYGLPLDQPSETPVLVLLRQINTLTNNGTRKASCSVLMIDRRDGRQIYASDEIGTQAYTYGLIGDPESNQVVLDLPGYEIRVQYTDKPRPPQPPVQDALSLREPIPQRDSRPSVNPFGKAVNPARQGRNVFQANNQPNPPPQP